MFEHIEFSINQEVAELNNVTYDDVMVQEVLCDAYSIINEQFQLNL